MLDKYEIRENDKFAKEQRRFVPHLGEFLIHICKPLKRFEKLSKL